MQSSSNHNEEDLGDRTHGLGSIELLEPIVGAVAPTFEGDEVERDADPQCEVPIGSGA